MWRWEGVIITSIYSNIRVSSLIIARYVTIKLQKNVAWIDTWSPNYTQANQGYVIHNCVVTGHPAINSFRPCLIIQDSSGFMHVKLGVVSSQVSNCNDNITPSIHLKFFLFIYIEVSSMSTFLLHYKSKEFDASFINIFYLNQWFCNHLSHAIDVLIYFSWKEQKDE